MLKTKEDKSDYQLNENRICRKPKSSAIVAQRCGNLVFNRPEISGRFHSQSAALDKTIVQK